MPILPKDLILSSSERAEVQRHLIELDRFTRLDQLITLRETTMTNDAALATMIAGLLVKGGKRLDKAAADATTEDYLDALEDLPAWTVREAIRKWNRAESIQLDPKKPHDFNWRPEPPTLRRLAYIELMGIKSRISSMQKLLDAAPLIEFSDDHRADMIKRIQTLIHDAVKPAEPPTPAEESAA